MKKNKEIVSNQLFVAVHCKVRNLLRDDLAKQVSRYNVITEEVYYEVDKFIKYLSDFKR